jgi:hypothetical protein
MIDFIRSQVTYNPFYMIALIFFPFLGIKRLKFLLRQSNIDILASLSQSLEENVYIYNQLLNVDARYILLFLTPKATGDMYFNARPYGLVSEKHVWISVSNPETSDSTGLTLVYGQNALNDLVG